MVKKWPFMSHRFSGIFFPKWKKMETKKFVFYSVAFDPIKIQTCLAPQNDCQQLSFLKDVSVVGKKMTRNDPKMAKLKGCIFYIELAYMYQALGPWFYLVQSKA